MKKQTPHNLRAEVYAATLVERGEYRSGDIHLVPVGDFERNILGDLAEVKTDKKKKQLQINVRRPEHADLLDLAEETVGEDKALATLKAVLLEELNRLRLEDEMTERRHLLGISPRLETIFDIQSVKDDRKRAWLAYLLPHAKTISQNTEFIAWALEKLTGKPVAVEVTKPQNTMTGDHACTIDTWRIGISTAITGEIISPKKKLKISIGPVPNAETARYLPGGSERQFLENTVLSRLMPGEVDWEIELQPNPDEAAFTVGIEKNNGAFIGISSWI